MERFKIPALIVGELVSLAWTALTITFDIFGVAPDRFTLTWKWWPLVAFLVFALLVYLHIFQLQRRLMPKLDIVFDTDKYPDCLMLGSDPDPNTGLKAEHRYYRVGVINTGGKTIDDVSVKIAGLEPNPLTFTNIPLALMHSQPNQSGVYTSVFTLNPSKQPLRFVDVAHKSTVGPRHNEIFLGAAAPNLAVRVGSGRYVLTLIAEGRDVLECRKSYIIDVDTSRNLVFQPYKPADAA